MKVVRFGVAGLGGAWQGVARQGKARVLNINFMEKRGNES